MVTTNYTRECGKDRYIFKANEKGDRRPFVNVDQQWGIHCGATGNY